MPVRIKTKISGIEEAKSQLAHLPRKFQQEILIDAVRGATEIIHSEVLTRSPVEKDGKRSLSSLKYGRLVENVRMFKLRFNIPEGVIIFRVSTGDAFWGRFLEYGTKKMLAKPWFRPALDASVTRAAAEMVRRMQNNAARMYQKITEGWK